MQTKLTILASAIIGISGVCAWKGHNASGLGFLILGVLVYVFAFTIKDRKDKQFEEIHKATTTKKQIEAIPPEEQGRLIELVKERCNTKYNLRKNEVREKFDSILSGYAARGFPLLPGLANKDISDLYLNELRAFSEILTETIFEVFNGAQRKIEHQPFIELSPKLIFQKSTELETTHSNFINHYFQTVGEKHSKIMKDSFKRQIEHEATLNASKISSQIKIKFMV